MAPANYERISGDEREAEHPLIARGDAADADAGVYDVSKPKLALPVQPPIYYDEGPFDAPSSDSEAETLLEKGRLSPGAAEDGLANGGEGIPGEKRTRSPALKCFVISICSLLLMAIIIGIFAAHSYTGSTFKQQRGLKHITMDHVFNGTFSVSRKSLRWVPEAGDGVYAISESGSIKLVDLKSNTTSDLVHLNDVKKEDGSVLYFAEWKLSPDMKYMLVKTDWRKQWRHSSFGNYYVHDIKEKTTRALIEPSDPAVTSYATWSPTGEAIAFVASNDVYILPNAAANAEPIRLTTSGNASLFHGVPDWVYEEEVLTSDFALWWSPDSTKLAFLRLDETLVDFYSLPFFNPTGDSNAVFPYTTDISMKYPKPGYANPLVSVHVFDLGRYEARQGGGVEDALHTLEWEGRQNVTNSIVSEVAWVADTLLLLKEVNRAADDGSVVLFDLGNIGRSERIDGKVVRKLGKDGEQGDDGWIESTQYVRPLPPPILRTLGTISGYLDIVNNSAGYNHIALFSPADSSKPIFVTDGEWEVSEGILGINEEKGLVYFSAAVPTSYERNVFSAPFPVSSASPTPPTPSNPNPIISLQSNTAANVSSLTDGSSPSWYGADFSPKAGFYLLSYKGPLVPWQSVFRTDKTADEYEYPVTRNERLNETIAEYQTPYIVRGTIESDGYELNFMELRPPNFDDSGRTKYPILFKVYGGPFSQEVHTKFELERDWHAYLACGLKYVTVVVDGRGTGYKGRRLRNPVRKNLGFFETQDQLNAAKIWAGKKYADPKRIGIWGWSYGGFMSAKVAEANAGIHTLAMSVAPVTSWRLYDSIYTERYMDLPATNPSGYVNASISNVTGFNNINYLLAHGSGDDNVHYANSAHLLDMLTQARVRGFRFRMFTDSDHSISTRGAYRELHEFMTDFLVEKWGKGGTRRGW